MPRYAERIPAPAAKKGAAPPGGRAPVQRSAVWHPIQLKAARTSMPGPAPAAKAESGSGLPGPLKAGVEALSGLAMDDVRVHRDSAEPAKHGALAFTKGGDIHLGPGQERHLPHEAWHVVQQKQGRVKPTRQLKRGVEINDEAGLECEADLMGQRALLGETERGAPISEQAERPGPAAVVQRLAAPETGGGVRMTMLPPLRFVSLLAETHREPPTGTLQFAGWVNASSGTDQKWDELIDGVRWYSDARGQAMWFLVENTGQVPKGALDSFKGMENTPRTWDQWSFMHWPKWENYVQTTIAQAAQADATANVAKNPNFNAAAMPEEVRGIGTDYLDKFKIVSRDEFNQKIGEIAAGLCALGKRTAYSCIISEAGKSNYWVTAKVLARVHELGGAPPRRIISVPAKEKGERVEQVRVELQGAGELVFLDDGSYSGAQMSKFIAKVVGNKEVPSHVGLVARSAEAKTLIDQQLRGGTYLANPIPIDPYSSKDLDTLYTGLGIAKAAKDANPDGNYALGFYYKVPDFASVRTKFLTPHSGPKPIINYSLGSLDVQRLIKEKKNVITGATEPYKAIETVASSVEEVRATAAPVYGSSSVGATYSGSAMGRIGLRSSSSSSPSANVNKDDKRFG